MFLTRRAAALVLLLTGQVLAGCSSEPPSQEDMLASAGNMVKPLPGLYRTTSRLTSFDLPSASPQEAQRMRTMMDVLEPQEGTICLTGADADEGFVALLRDIQEGDCAVESFDAGATRLHARLQCPGAGGSSSTVEMTGTGSAESSRMQLDIEQRGPAIPGGLLEMQFVVENQRVGDC
ncbi:hypothetical protein GCM10009127_14350 [Alteraurantiacibacter aestuarii]|uniref:DUF3617 family protein n=1 Tax=Alteraurantiacibacter aestuarii TaxID=650004 RepID=A0A844ZMB1_9SPHN|nr:DUF3617 domain-containing protein [Alteraurantiacibacter aestuarii]MXO87977.1 DUF3617 family protein [Alteraurantiacibacter aestuarii]